MLVQYKQIITYLLIVNFINNLDHGVIPGQILYLKTKQHLSEFEIGLIGSMLFLGNIFGSFLNAFSKQSKGLISK